MEAFGPINVKEKEWTVAGFVQVSVAYMPQDEWWKGKHGNTRQHTRPRTACPLHLPYLSSFHTLTFLDLVTTQPSLSDPDLPTSGSVTSLKPSYSKGCLSCTCAPAAVSAAGLDRARGVVNSGLRGDAKERQDR